MLDPLTDLPRIDGEAVWHTLTLAQQAAIGSAALDLVAARVGYDAAQVATGKQQHAIDRAFALTRALCLDRLVEQVAETVPVIDPDRPPLPLIAGEPCSGCGDLAAAPGSCACLPTASPLACAPAGRCPASPSRAPAMPCAAARLWCPISRPCPRSRPCSGSAETPPQRGHARPSQLAGFAGVVSVATRR